MPRGSGQMCVWAWEFLRRRPEYRTFWKEKIEPFTKVCDHFLLDGGKVTTFQARSNFSPYHDELRTRFGVDTPSPPDSSTPAHFIANYISWASNDGGELQQIKLKEHQIAIFIDLTRPLKPQFERARKAAESEQKCHQLDIKKVGIATLVKSYGASLATQPKPHSETFIKGIVFVSEMMIRERIAELQAHRSGQA